MRTWHLVTGLMAIIALGVVMTRPTSSTTEHGAAAPSIFVSGEVAAEATSLVGFDRSPALADGREATVQSTETTGRGDPRSPQHVFTIPLVPVLVQFPDGEFVSVSFRRVPAVRVPRQTVPISTGAMTENERAQTAFAHYQRAAQCLAAVTRANEGMVASCVDTADHYDAERKRWLEIAAEAGQVHAVRLHAHENIGSDTAVALFEAAWRAGYISPLGQLADHYFDRSLDGDVRNQQRGLAYLWLQAHLQAAAAGEGRRLYVADLFEKLSDRERRMAPSDVEVAMQLAKEILRENVQCCFGP